MRIIQLAAVLAGVVLAGCTSTVSELAASRSTKSDVRSYKENYQEIYRRVSSTATRCGSGSLGAYASLTVDSELYNELGFGEISLSLINFGVRNYYWDAKIEKAGTGATMTVHSGSTINNSMWLNKVIGWADGKEDC